MDQAITVGEVLWTLLAFGFFFALVGLIIWAASKIDFLH